MTDVDHSKPIAVFTHHPPFEVPVGPEPLHYKDRAAMERLGAALQHSQRVAGVFSGHIHRPANGNVGNIRASVVPCIATPLRRGDYPNQMRIRPVYHVHRFDPGWGFASETRIVGAAMKLHLGERQLAEERNHRLPAGLGTLDLKKMSGFANHLIFEFALERERAVGSARGRRALRIGIGDDELCRSAKIFCRRPQIQSQCSQID